MFKNKFMIVLLLVLAAALLFGGWKILRSGSREESVSATFRVKKGPLAINVMESGTIKAREQIIIKNQVEGRTSIIYLIPEGTIVKQGDLLVQLDSSTLEDNKIDQDIRVQNAEAAFINAQENLAVVENQAQSDLDLAELKLKFAEVDMKKYEEGEYPNELRKSEADITLAKEELTRAQETLKWSKTLYEEKYLSQTELQADELSAKKKSLDVELSENNKELLTQYTYQRQKAQLESDVHQAKMALERTTRKAKADVVQAQTELKAKEAEFRRQEDKLQKIVDQITKTKIVAPADGLVIYATSARSGGFRGNVTPLEEGQDVYERQEIIYLPTANSSKAEITLHESNLEKVSLGMSAVVTVDALPGRKFHGTVARIAPLPDAQSMWMNPDLKVYTTEIYLDENDSSLRTGMSCQAEINIGYYSDALYIPVQAVIRVGGAPTVYSRQGAEFIPQPVEIGLDNNVMVHILSGLQEGEEILLTPPLKAAAKETDAQDSFPNKSVPQDQGKKEDSSSASNSAVNQNASSASTGSPSSTPAAGELPAPRDERRRGAQETDSSDQRQQRRRQFENMTPEQREEMRKKLESMTPEEREQLRKRFQGDSSSRRQRSDYIRNSESDSKAGNGSDASGQNPADKSAGPPPADAPPGPPPAESPGTPPPAPPGGGPPPAAGSGGPPPGGP